MKLVQYPRGGVIDDHDGDEASDSVESGQSVGRGADSRGDKWGVS